MDINLKVGALERLVDIVGSGIGGTAGFFFSRTIARREAQAKQITAEGEAEVQRILADGQANTMRIIAKAQADARSNLVSPNAVVRGEIDFGELVQQRIQFQEEKRMSNIHSVVLQAAEEIVGKEVEDHEVDHDWAARFFSEVQDVSSAELQELWAKILAGEVEHPGNTSIKALGVLKNLDKNVAVLFRRLCSLSISLTTDGISFLDSRAPNLGDHSEGNALKDYGLDFFNLNTLEEHGLIISEYNSWIDIKGSIGLPLGEGNTRLVHSPFCFQKKYWILRSTTHSSPRKEFRLSGVAFSNSGRELSRVVDLEAAGEYARDAIAYFEKNGLTMVEVENWEPKVL